MKHDKIEVFCTCRSTEDKGSVKCRIGIKKSNRIGMEDCSITWLCAGRTARVAESQAGVRPVTGRPDSPGLPGRPARSDKLMLLNNLLKIHG